MNDVKISIIMPVYKVEEYVGKAIESILAQTFLNILSINDFLYSSRICSSVANSNKVGMMFTPLYIIYNTVVIFSAILLITGTTTLLPHCLYSLAIGIFGKR